MTMLATAKTPTETLTLERTGQCPLRFKGTLLTTACGQFVEPPKDKANTDYYTVSIYTVSASSLFVVAIDYTKELPGRDKSQHHSVFQTNDVSGVLARFDPVPVIIGMPPNVENRADRQALLETKCRRQYQTLVSAVLQSFPETLDVEPEREEITADDIEQAIEQLNGTDNGRYTIKKIVDWQANGGHDLSRQDQEAVFTLLDGFWNEPRVAQLASSWVGSTRNSGRTSNQRTTSFPV